MKAKDEGRLVEMFGTGTAAIVSPVGNILYKDQMQSIPYSDDENAISNRYVNCIMGIHRCVLPDNIKSKPIKWFLIIYYIL